MNGTFNSVAGTNLESLAAALAGLFNGAAGNFSNVLEQMKAEAAEAKAGADDSNRKASSKGEPQKNSEGRKEEASASTNGQTMWVVSVPLVQALVQAESESRPAAGQRAAQVEVVTGTSAQLSAKQSAATYVETERSQGDDTLFGELEGNSKTASETKTQQDTPQPGPKGTRGFEEKEPNAKPDTTTFETTSSESPRPASEPAVEVRNKQLSVNGAFVTSSSDPVHDPGNQIPDRSAGVSQTGPKPSTQAVSENFERNPTLPAVKLTTSAGIPEQKGKRDLHESDLPEQVTQIASSEMKMAAQHTDKTKEAAPNETEVPDNVRTTGFGTSAQTERLTERLAGSELRFGWKSSDSGAMQVSTSLHDRVVDVKIAAERADTATALRAEVPVLDSHLREHSLRLGETQITAMNSLSAQTEMGDHRRGSQERNSVAARVLIPEEPMAEPEIARIQQIQVAGGTISLLA